MFSTIQTKGEYDVITGHNFSQLGSIDVVGGKMTPTVSSKTAKIDKTNSKPTCLILDQIDGFFNDDLKAQWTLLNFLYRTKTSESMEIEDLFKEDQKQQKQLTSKRPIIFIGENVYSYGLKAFRKNALIFRLFKNHDQVCKKAS